jgi:hypothetical protein
MSGRGAKPGERRGGRAKGTPNRTTTEAALRAAREVQEAKQSGRKLGKEILSEFANIFRERAFKARTNEKRFAVWARLACDTAARLAPYESPQYARIETPAPPPSIGEGEPPRVIRFGLRVFEGGRPVQGDDTYQPNVARRDQ